MEVLRFIFNPIGVNTYIVFDPATKECAIIDPGMLYEEEIEALKNSINKRSLKPVHLINTHLHLDHAFGASTVRKDYGLGVKASQKDEFLGRSLPLQARQFGMNLNLEPLEVDEYLSDGDVLKIGNGELKVIEVPGHSPGGLVFYDEADKYLFTGDSLFRGSIGRTDLEGGDMDQLLDALMNKIMTLPDDTKVFPGHGDETTIGRERLSNPFIT